MSFKNLWLDNKEFLMKSGVGVVAFSLLYFFISGWDAEAHDKISKARTLQQRVVQLHRDLRDSYWLEQGKVEAYEAHEAALRKRLCLPDAQEVGDDADLNTLQIRFQKALADAWARVRQDANRVGIALPEQIDVADFGIDEEAGIDAYRAYYSYLSVIRRVLQVLVAAEVAEFGTPEPENPEWLEIADNDGVYCLQRPVMVSVTGTYESFQVLLESVQNLKPDAGACDFLQVRIRQLRSSKRQSTEEQSLLDAELEFVGFTLTKSGEPTKRRATSGRRGRQRGRRN